MLVYFDQGLQDHGESCGGRYIPYGDVTHDGAGRYYDFVKHPDQIPNVLEDFLPYGDEGAIQRFYSLLRWINGPNGILESTDCALRAPDTTKSPGRGDGASLEIVGRLMIVFRDHRRNTLSEQTNLLAKFVAEELRNVDPHWRLGAIGYAHYPAHFARLGDDPSFGTTGHELCLQFWAWGSSDLQCFESLGRLFENLNTSLMAVPDRL